jgi:hypothetical protein
LLLDNYVLTEEFVKLVLNALIKSHLSINRMVSDLSILNSNLGVVLNAFHTKKSSSKQIVATEGGAEAAMA